MEKAKGTGREVSKASFGSYFSRAHKLRAATVLPEILGFSDRYNLRLTDGESANKDDKSGNPRPVFEELAGKEENWLAYPEDSIYAAHLDELTKDAPKLIALEQLINALGEDVCGRPEKLVIFTSSPIVSLVVTLV